jgi:hypothetical protein
MTQDVTADRVLQILREGCGRNGIAAKLTIRVEGERAIYTLDGPDPDQAPDPARRNAMLQQCLARVALIRVFLARTTGLTYRMWDVERPGGHLTHDEERYVDELTALLTSAAQQSSPQALEEVLGRIRAVFELQAQAEPFTALQGILNPTSSTLTPAARRQQQRLVE